MSRTGSDAESVEIGGVPGTLVHAEAFDAPAVLLFIHRSGTDEFVLSIAERLAAAGLPVLVPNLFAGMPDDLEPEQRKRLLVDGDVISLAADCVALLRDRYPDRGAPASLGFCMGGRLAFLAAAAGTGIGRACCFYAGELDRPWHARSSPIELVRPGIGPIQLHRGTLEDSATPQAEAAAAEAVVAAGGYLEAHIYAGARHAFANHNFPAAYHPQASRRALRSAFEFMTDSALTLSEPGR